MLFRIYNLAVVVIKGNNNMFTQDNNGFEFYNDLVLASAVRLIKENASTSTLDIKEELRKRYEIIDLGLVSFKLVITQQQVSESMDWLTNNGYFSYVFNGLFRIYYLNSIEDNDKQDKEKEDIEDVSVSVKEALEIINDLIRGDEIIITFIKRDNTKRIINAEIEYPNRGDGLIKVIDKDMPDGKDGSNIRNVDLRKVLSFKYDNINYIIDKNIR